MFGFEKRKKETQLRNVEDRIQFFESRIHEWRREREAAKGKIERGRFLKDAGLISRGERQVKDIDSYIRATQGILEILEDFRYDARFRKDTEEFKKLGDQFPSFKNKYAEGFESVNAALYHSSKQAEQTRQQIEDLVSAFRGAERTQVAEPTAAPSAPVANAPMPVAPADDLAAKNRELSKRIEEKERKLAKYR